MEQVKDDFSDENKIFFELAGAMRLQILLRLRERSFRLSEIAKELNVNLQEAHRNVDRLIEAEFIEKDSDGFLSLTTYSRIILEQVQTFSFLLKHKAYFKEHTLGDLPKKFIQRMGVLYNCEVIHGAVKVFDIWKKVRSDAKEYIRQLSPQIPLHLIQPLTEKIRSGIKFSYILPEDCIIPKGRKDLLESLGWRELLHTDLVKRKMTKKVQVMTVLNERQAMASFPALNGETDLNRAFYSEDRLFHEWCLDLFEYKWLRSEIFDESKLKEV